jgi:hypothetical protein
LAFAAGAVHLAGADSLRMVEGIRVSEITPAR